MQSPTTDPTTSQPKLLYSRRLNRFITKHIANFNILLFEFVGTGFFAYGVMVCLNSTTPLVPTSIEGVFASLFISLCLFLSLVFVGPLTGGHFNPAVTMAFMIKKEGRVGWSKALLYMVAQMTGAWMGALFARAIGGIDDAPLISSMPWLYVFYAFLCEIVGTFLLVFFVMIATTSDTTFCSNSLELYLFISTILMIAREYSYRSQGLNPAFAVAFEFFYTAYTDSWYLWKYVWATFFGPFVGAVLAVVFFQYFYRRFVIVYKTRRMEEANYVRLKELTK